MNKLCIVVPCYNEEQALGYTNAELAGVVKRLIQSGKIDKASFILYVDDGSRDDTWNVIENFRKKDSFVFGLKLARNMGHQNALTAGFLTAMNYADMVISIDADLQMTLLSWKIWWTNISRDMTLYMESATGVIQILHLNGLLRWVFID